MCNREGGVDAQNLVTEISKQRRGNNTSKNVHRRSWASSGRATHMRNVCVSSSISPGIDDTGGVRGDSESDNSRPNEVTLPRGHGEGG